MTDAAGLADPYPNSVPLDRFAHWTRSALAPFGFTAENTLPILGVCRDELMFAVDAAVAAEWSAAFDMSGLAAMVFLGSSGMSAAVHHAPGLDGRRRYLIVVLPHIGVSDRAGGVGRVARAGQTGESAACGALIALQGQLATGNVPAGLDPDDLEMSWLRMQVVPRLRSGSVPDLVELTEVVRRCATDEAVRLSAGLVADSTADLAVISGVLVHRPDGDHVAVADAWIALGDDAVRRPLTGWSPRPPAAEPG